MPPWSLSDVTHSIQTHTHARTHKTGHKKPFQDRHIFLQPLALLYSIRTRPRTIPDAHLPPAASTIAWIQVCIHFLHSQRPVTTVMYAGKVTSPTIRWVYSLRLNHRNWIPEKNIKLSKLKPEPIQKKNWKKTPKDTFGVSLMVLSADSFGSGTLSRIRWHLYVWLMHLLMWMFAAARTIYFLSARLKCADLLSWEYRRQRVFKTRSYGTRHSVITQWWTQLP